MGDKIVEYIQGLLQDFNWRKARNGLLILLCAWLVWTYIDQFMSIERLKQAHEVESVAQAKLKELSSGDPNAPSPQTDEVKFWKKQAEKARLEIKCAMDERYSEWKPFRWVKRVILNGWVFFYPALACQIWLTRRWNAWEAWELHADDPSCRHEPSFAGPLFWFLLFLGATLISGGFMVVGHETYAARVFHVSVAGIGPFGWKMLFEERNKLWLLVGVLVAVWLPISSIIACIILDIRKDKFRAKAAAKKVTSPT